MVEVESISQKILITNIEEIPFTWVPHRHGRSKYGYTWLCDNSRVWLFRQMNLTKIIFYATITKRNGNNTIVSYNSSLNFLYLFIGGDFKLDLWVFYCYMSTLLGKCFRFVDRSLFLCHFFIFSHPI